MISHLISHLQIRWTIGLFTIALAVVLLFSIPTIAAPDLATQELQDQRYQAAATKLEKILKQPQSDPLYQIQLLSNLGIAYKNLGQYSQSADRHLAAAKQMMQLMQQTNEAQQKQTYRRNLGQILLNLGTTQELLGNYDRARQAYIQSLRLARETQSPPIEILALNNLGGLQSKLGEDNEALQNLEAALKISQTQPDRATIANITLNLASIHHFRHHYTQARPFYDEALKLAQTQNNQVLQAKILSDLGLLEEDEKNYPTAIANHKKSLAIAKSLDDPELQATALNNLGHTLRATNQLTEAEAVLHQSIELLDRLRLNLSDTYKVSKLDTQLNTYSLLQKVLVEANKPEAALEAAEQGRARAFAELLAQRQNPSKNMDELPAITVENIRETAKKQNATLIEYAIVPDEDFKFRGKQRANAGKLLIWVVNPNGKITMRQVDLILKRKTQGTLDFTISVARCLSPNCPTLADGLNLPAIPDSPDPVPDAFFYPALPELYQTLIQPIADLLPKSPTDRIVIIPQESLFLVPFAALPNQKGTYFIEDHTLAYAPSIQVLGLIQLHPTSTAPNPLIVGNPSPMPENLPELPASETEAIAIAKLFNTIAITGAAATRAKVYPKLEYATHIHLATHGLLEYGQIEAIDTPGAIALAPSPGDNGLLTANDVFNLSLNAELVVLSACDTGRGTLTGDGVLGLSRSWLAAGTSSLVVSLWAVNDKSTSELMTDFYRALQTNPDRAVALRSAMLTTLKQYPSPRDWAAFTLMGL
jgi:CHAT domain-containing protein